MAFRLRLGESVTHGLHRVVKKELRSARARLRQTTPPDDEAIHEARKSIKKVRAIMRLIAADEGSGLRRCRKLVRSINRTLSGIRDADAKLAILTQLKQKSPDGTNDAIFARLRGRLSAEKKAAMAAARSDDAWADLDRKLRKLRSRAKRWKSAHSGFGGLAPGIELTYRRGRRALTRARRRRRPVDFHEWRKQMKALWYQLRLIEPCAGRLERDVQALHRAETCLGDDHNLVVLNEGLSKDVPPSDVKRLRRIADQHQRHLREEAISSAAHLYQTRAETFVRRVEEAWKAGRRELS